MGIRNLSKFLQKHIPNLYQQRPLRDYSGQKFAIDILLYMYKFKTIYKGRWLQGFVNMIMLLKRNNIQGIFVYDTKSPALKSARVQERKDRRSQATRKIEVIKSAFEEYEKSGHTIVSPVLTQIIEKHVKQISRLLRPMDMEKFIIDPVLVQQEIARLEKQIIYVSSNDIALTKELLDLLGMVHINSETEAETLCAFMCCHGQVDAVLSNDTDVMVYGTPTFLTNLTKDIVTEIKFPSLLEGVGLTYDEFRDFCILCGTDYNNNIYRIGSEKAYKYIKNHSSIENIRDKVPVDVTVLNHESVREIFTVPTELKTMDLTEKPPNMERLEIFLVENRCNQDIMKYLK